MRLFTTLDEAIPEIRRDLSKAPTYRSFRVQNQEQVDTLMQEAQNYGVTILPGGIPSSPYDVADLVQKHFPAYESPEMSNALVNWLVTQRKERLFPAETAASGSLDPSDVIHPFLKDLQEGNHYGYTYRERLVGALGQVVTTLLLDKHSRRAYWPVFTPQDALRSAAMTRIPCSLGYFFAIREDPETIHQARLHVTYVSRSCDFEKFWATDVWFANQLKCRVLAELNAARSQQGEPEILEGATSHMAFSFHRFTTLAEELY